MQDFPDESSPWGQQSSEDEIVPSFSIPDDAGAPWGGASDNDDDDTNYNGMNDSYNPYGSTYGETQNAFVEDTYNQFDSPSQESTTAAHSPPKSEPTEEAPAPQLKSASQRGKNNKKKRAGTVKVQSVGSDPLAVHASQLDDVALSSSQHHSSSSSSTAPANSTNSSREAQPAYSGASPLNPDSINPWAPEESINDAPSSSWPDPLHEQRSIHDTSTQQREEPSDFEISVSDPATVGELSSTHTEYTVLMTTTYDPYEIKESAVQRRYRDFRWLYRTLEHNHPGIVVPPPPGKQALGRFNDDFVQFRRAALEQMLVKITKHPALKGDKDLEAFLTSNDFGEYLDSRMKSDSELKNATISAYQADGEGSTNGSGDANNNSSGSGSSGAFGFIGSLTGALMLSRGNEADPWTVEKRLRLGELETSLREVIKDFIAVGLHRQQLSDSLKEYADVIRALSDIEATRRLSTVLRSFAKVQERLSQIAERQRKQNAINLEATLDEHLRVIGSVKDAINARQKVFSEAEEAATELEKKQQSLDRLVKYNSTQQDRQMGLEQDISELGKKASELHQKAGSIAHLVESEINRITDEKIAEFRNSVELYLESTIESHKETIEVWETFYTRHFTKS